MEGLIVKERSPHYFFAVSLPPEVKDILKNKCDGMGNQGSFKKWVHYKDYHITLAFLGDSAEESLKNAKSFIKEKIYDFPAFPAEIQNIGTFGKKESPRILWADIQENDKLHLLRALVYTCCQEAGYKLEARAFTPHITLARKWIDEEPYSNAPGQFLHSIPFTIDEIALYETNTETIPKYRKIATLPLKIN